MSGDQRMQLVEHPTRELLELRALVGEAGERPVPPGNRSVPVRNVVRKRRIETDRQIHPQAVAERLGAVGTALQDDHLGLLLVVRIDGDPALPHAVRPVLGVRGVHEQHDVRLAEGALQLVAELRSRGGSFEVRVRRQVNAHLVAGPFPEEFGHLGRNRAVDMSMTNENQRLRHRRLRSDGKPCLHLCRIARTE